MLRFDLPQHDTRYSVWLGLLTYDELPHGLRESSWPLSVEMAQRDAVTVSSPYNHDIIHTIPYTELLTAFPDIDPETVYLVTHLEYHELRFMQKYIVDTQVEPILDTTMTITEWIELYPLEPSATTSEDLMEPVIELDNPAERIIQVRRALTDDYLDVPFSRVMEKFPDLDPARTSIATSYSIEFEGLVNQAAVDAEFVKRGWRLIGVPDASNEELKAHEDLIRARYPKLENDDTPSAFLYQDRGYRLRIR